MSRRESFKKEFEMEEGEELEMPPCDSAYLLAYLFELGPTVSNGMGDAPISHGEIESWMRNTGVALNPWECRVLKRLSVDYMRESHKASARDCPAPWEDAPYVKPLPSLTAERTRDSLRALANL